MTDILTRTEDAAVKNASNASNAAASSDGSPASASSPAVASADSHAHPAGIVLGANQYGKAEVRVVKVTRDTDRHEIEDLNVTSQLRGDFAGAHLDGDNAHVVATDTQKNTIFAFARDGVGSPEQFLQRLADHFIGSFDWVTGGRWLAESYAWERIVAHGAPHDHSFVRTGQEVRTAAVIADGDTRHVFAGLKDLTVLKTTRSGFEGYPKDRYTTLQETTDRILATSVSTRWRYEHGAEVDYNAAYDGVKAILLEAFTENYSAALQTTLFEMGQAVLEAHPEIAEIRFSMPNKHHFVVDLAPFGLDNPNEVFYASDRSYGLIEASVGREGATSPAEAWAGLGAFC
jgi:urate oxidase